MWPLQAAAVTEPLSMDVNVGYTAALYRVYIWHEELEDYVGNQIEII